MRRFRRTHQLTSLRSDKKPSLVNGFMGGVTLHNVYFRRYVGLSEESTMPNTCATTSGVTENDTSLSSVSWGVERRAMPSMT